MIWDVIFQPFVEFGFMRRALLGCFAIADLVHVFVTIACCIDIVMFGSHIIAVHDRAS